MKVSLLLCFLCGSFSPMTVALPNGLSRTPIMGYNAWYDMGRNINEQGIHDVVQFFLDHDLKSYGYKYINLDDAWAAGRDSKTHVLYANTSAFSSRSLKPLADYVHSHGLLFGVYTDRGPRTCAGHPGSKGYEKLDAMTFASWTVDLVKEDSCDASNEPSVAFQEYGLMRDSLNATGRPMDFAVCGAQSWYAPKGRTLGNSWRIGPDDGNWKNILVNIDINSNLSVYAGPGGWNNPGSLLVAGERSISEAQAKIQMSVWAIMASPLIIGGKIRSGSKTSLDMWMNRDVIGVNQDRLGKQGIRLVGGNLALAEEGKKASSSFNVWGRVLSNGARAFVFFNVGGSSVKASCDRNCFDKVQFGGKKVRTRDLWSKQEGTFDTTNTFTVDLGAEDVRMFKFTPL